MKKTSAIHHLSQNASATNAIWLKIVYIGFGLFALSIIFHAWLFISSGKIAAVSSTVPVTIPILDQTKLNAIISDYQNRQSQKTSSAQADSTLTDPSK